MQGECPWQFQMTSHWIRTEHNILIWASLLFECSDIIPLICHLRSNNIVFWWLSADLIGYIGSTNNSHQLYPSQVCPDCRVFFDCLDLYLASPKCLLEVISV